ncbi:MAG: DUF5915 domain-containing protein [Planctomycetota bacterium]|nr:DUF5915 domain-containing protein [Planctomycetota bacterium]
MKQTSESVNRWPNCVTRVNRRKAISLLADVISEELNVKKITAADNLDDLVHYLYKPNLKTLGPKYGKLLNALRTDLPQMDGKLLAPLRRGETVEVTIQGEPVTLEPADVLISTERASDWVSADDSGVQIALSTTMTPELIQEGIARDFIRQVQQMRKDHNLEIQDRIAISFHAADADSRTAVESWSETIKGETLADGLQFSGQPVGKEVNVGAKTVWVEVKKSG